MLVYLNFYHNDCYQYLTDTNQYILETNIIGKIDKLSIKDWFIQFSILMRFNQY